MYEFMNANPCKKLLGDCVVRALSIALNQSWYRTAIDLCIEGLMQCDMQNSNAVWGEYLQRKGFKKHTTLGTMTFEEFSEQHPDDLYIVASGSHVAVIQNGSLLDNWDSSDVPVAFYFTKEKE